MHSAIYQGYVRHRRFLPRAHKFSYEVFMMYLDLDELDEVLALSPLWSKKPWFPAHFRRADFLGDAQLPLKQAVRQRIHEVTGEWHDGPIRMLANLRYYGFVINPISCYYCFDADGALRYVVAEVTNTPWNERVSYVLPCDPRQRFLRTKFDKSLHVSPFNPMDMQYRWCSNNPSAILSLNLETRKDGEVHMDATMALKRREINATSLTMILLQHPWMTAKVAGAIYWQALKLWIKRNPFYDHPSGKLLDGPDQPTITRLKTKT
ncbi:MAG: DUF1365 domain-containing protein [Gammaproteobacteria bacterium]|nr:MAG: DUF1365 domain-containing protein [Gammaproteobacteria bacterium]